MQPHEFLPPPLQTFDDWYPEFGHIFARIAQENCSAELKLAQSGERTLFGTEWRESWSWFGAGAFVVPLVDCILAHSPEYIKSNMGAASVVLGLTPSILGSLGSSATETSMLAIIGRRPFLALCLSIGSPAVVPEPLFQSSRSTGILEAPPSRRKMLFFNFDVELIILVAEHAAALAAIANVITLGIELGSRVTLAFSPYFTWLALAWIFLGVVPHLITAVALYRRVKVDKEKIDNLTDRLRAWVARRTKGRPIKFTVEQETWVHTGITGFTTLYTTFHLIFGTLIFSSAMFISVRDSVPVISRFLASVVVCRMVLTYELARLNHLCREKDGFHYVEQSSRDEAEAEVPAEMVQGHAS